MVSLEIEGLSAGYNGKKILKNISLKVDDGDFIGIIGPNGCGKSTLIRGITGVVDHYSGNVYLDGMCISEMGRTDIARTVAVVPQNTLIGFPFTVEEVVLMGRNPYTNRFHGLEKEDYRVAKRAIELAGLKDFKDRTVNTLSGGELQRVAIARALAQTPKVLLLDEATAHLDIGYKIEVMDMIERMNREKGLTVLSVHHNLDMAARYCSKLTLMDDGKIRAVGKPEDVLTPSHLRAVYGIEATVNENPRDGTLYISPMSLRDIRKAAGKKVHVICGGGTGGRLMKELVDRGYRVSAGVLNAMDTDIERAEFLDIEVITEAPFSPVSEERRRENILRIKEAQTVILTDFPVGPGNMSNLTAGLEALEMGKNVIILDGKGMDDRDHTDGEACEVFRVLMDNGARVASSISDILKKV